MQVLSLNGAMGCVHRNWVIYVSSGIPVDLPFTLLGFNRMSPARDEGTSFPRYVGAPTPAEHVLTPTVGRDGVPST